MTTQDVNQLLAIMKANYSYAFKAMSQDEKYMLLCTWTVTLHDIPSDIVMLAVMQLVSQSKWLPTVAEIREKCREIHYAAATPDTTYDMMLANGMQFTPEQQREHERREAKRKYIAEATKHLRNEDNGALTLDSLLLNPAFEGIGMGRPSFLLQVGGSQSRKSAKLIFSAKVQYADDGKSHGKEHRHDWIDLHEGWRLLPAYGR